MKITGIELYRADMKLKEPYVIAYETIDRAVNIFIRINTNKGISGHGCCAPDLAVTGETPESVLKSLDAQAIPFLLGTDPLRISRIMTKLRL